MSAKKQKRDQSNAAKQQRDNDLKIRPGEQWFKEWVAEEAMRLGISSGAVHNRLARGGYAGRLEFRRPGSRTVFVKEVA